MIARDARSIARSVNAGVLDPGEVAEAFLARIAERNPALNALVDIDPGDVRRQAGEVRRRAAAGEAMGLAGVPVIIKDNIWVAGRRIAQGSRLFADHVAPLDAIAVTRLRRAGAVIIGIGNCSEFACKGVTNSPFHGAARHPLDPELTPGGSSGGNAAALAADLAPIALGTDAGGSGRRPAAHTGVVGFKPSFGAIPNGPGFPEPVWGISTLAPMGRTVGDAAALFEAIAGPDPGDPESTAVAPAAPVEPRRLRIAFSPRLGLDVPVDADVAEAVAAAVQSLASAGWPVARADPQWPAGVDETAIMPLQHAGLAALYGAAWRQDPSPFDPDIGAQIESGLSLGAVATARALDASQGLKRALAAFLLDHDILICPTAPCVAWPHTRLGPVSIGGIAAGPRGHAVFTPLLNHALVPALSLPCGSGRGGLPVGLQIVAARGGDRRVLAIAALAERLLAGADAKAAGPTP